MAKDITIYGIKNCDTMKKARAWLDDRGIGYAFHDYKTSGIERAKLESWAAKAGWETLLNKAGTTFRKLPEGDKGRRRSAPSGSIWSSSRASSPDPAALHRPLSDWAMPRQRATFLVCSSKVWANTWPPEPSATK